jgi:hypothetical protein
MADRYKVECPHCGAPSHQQEIQLQLPNITKMAVGQVLTNEKQIASEMGPDWRETPGSRRMANDEPERLYSLPGDVTRRHSKKGSG